MKYILILLFIQISFGQKPEFELDSIKKENGVEWKLLWHEVKKVNGEWWLERYYIPKSQWNEAEPDKLHYECKIREEEIILFQKT